LHIPDGFLDAKTWGACWVLGGAALTYGVLKTKETLQEHQIPLMGAVAAFIFAAQMVNFPIARGTSGHLLGAVLAATVLGPWAACVTMAIVIALQAFVFLDGGITTLGANILNMAVIAPLTGYWAYQAISRLWATRLGDLTATFIGSWVSVILAAAACAIELALSGMSPLGAVFPAMVKWHTLIGIGEGAITTIVVACLSQARQGLACETNICEV
jgi:cobalt/nickel transport system permease protein